MVNSGSQRRSTVNGWRGAAATRADVAMLQLGLTWLLADLARVVHAQSCGGCTVREIHARNFWWRVWARAAFYGAVGSCFEIVGSSFNWWWPDEGEWTPVAACGEAAVAEQPELRAAREGAWKLRWGCVRRLWNGRFSRFPAIYWAAENYKKRKNRKGQSRLFAGKH